MKTVKVGLISIAIGCLSGCVQQIRPTEAANITSSHVVEKNYSIGQKMVAYVGQPIVKVKDYQVINTAAKMMAPSENFTFSGGIVSISGEKGKSYPVRGQTTIDGRNLKIVNFEGSNLSGGAGFGILVNPDGSIYNKMLNDNILMMYTFKAIPENVRFTEITGSQIDYRAGYLNYELIYGGTDGKAITITYREYSSDDMARPAFFQNVVYEVGKQQIRFKDTVLQVFEVSNEKIVFTVVSDGLK